MMLLNSIHACAPDSNNFLDADVLLPMAKFYNLDLSAFHMEVPSRSLIGRHLGLLCGDISCDIV